ncbi:WXG100 family type VII secretion target [Glycomyces artemisiae]|uniref:ESAT-6-like protein n=1 Tax=Glycomyces artemisiae TaxID=1076443 RepID=A0A2T0U8A5_9ACTN|nr:WXG100 family type VII secretion target [Glycomyces artemisiae]PRY54155.1 WXG100 family type VII secretion target [Glycomyces artemisiae]
MAGAISLDYATMEESYSRIINDSQSINDSLADLGAKLDALEWDGADREAYMAQREEWEQSMAKLNEILEAVGNAVDNARQRYADTEAANAARFR